MSNQFTLLPDPDRRNQSAASLVAKAVRLEREAEDLRTEADEMEERADALRKKAAAMLVGDGLDAQHIELLDAVMDSPRDFAEDAKRRLGSHPLLEPLRSLLAKLDDLFDEVHDREPVNERDGSKAIGAAIKSLEIVLHHREISAYKERRAA